MAAKRKFTRLDLKPYFNAGREPSGWHPAIAARLEELPEGQQTFWGVPFDLGPAKGNCLLVLDHAGPEGSGKSNESLSIGLSGTASYIVIAHFCDQWDDPEGRVQLVDYAFEAVNRLGEQLAEYVLVYADNSEHHQSIRRRFEVGEALVVGGRMAFVARPHVEGESLPWRGPYPAGQWGGYQTSVGLTSIGPIWATGFISYWLYALGNPCPDQELSALRLESRDCGRMAVAGITLYHGREHPLRHRRLESMRVTLPAPVFQDGVDISVDLGGIGRTCAVPMFDAEHWLNDKPKGWGEQNTPAQLAPQLLLDVTASPDATLNVAGREIDLRPIFKDGHGESADGLVRVEIVTPSKTWVHGTIVDGATGRPTPARIHFRARDGRYLPPYGHRHEVNDDWFEDYGGDLKLGSTQYAYVDGRFQIELPLGEVYVEIAKGFEYEPIRQRLDIHPGQRELTLPIQRTLDWRRQGWVTADTHVHFLSPQTAWLEAQAEGVNVVNLLAAQLGDLFTNVADLTGDLSRVSHDDTLLWVGTENRQHMLGHLGLLGVKGEPVFPMSASGPQESYLGDSTWSSMAEWADLCREREGLVVIPHFPSPYCEVAADVVLGKVDAAEIRCFAPFLESFNVREWYRFLNCGYRLGAVSGTDKMSAGMPVGGMRTYTYLGEEELSFANWAKAVRAGRTFATSGPLISLMVEGCSPGDEIMLPPGGGTLELEAWVQSVQPFNELQIVANGEIVAKWMTEQGALQTRLLAKVRLEKSAWLAARCLSRLQLHYDRLINVAAHTSPVYVRCEGEEVFSPSDATYMLTLIDGGLAWLDTLSIQASPEHHARIRGVFEAAQVILNQRVTRYSQGGHKHSHR